MRSILVRVSDVRCIDVVGGLEIDVYEQGGFIGVGVERPGKMPILGGCDHSVTMLGWCGPTSEPESKDRATRAIAEFHAGYSRETIRSIDMRPYFREMSQADKDAMEAARQAERESNRPVALFFDIGRSELSEERLNALVGRRVAAVEVRPGSGGAGKLTLV